MNKNRQQDKRGTRNRKTRDHEKIRHFLEELSWLLSTYQNLDFRALPDLVRVTEHESRPDVSGISGYISKNPNIHFLVGALPQLFDDTSIFSTNEDIASFAQEILGLRVPRWKKKSKYEIIGHVLCNVYKLNDRRLSMLVTALTKLVSGDTKAKQIVRAKKDQKSNWNEIIRRLSQSRP